MNPVRSNPLKTRSDVESALKQLIEPLRPYYSEGKAHLRMGATASGCTIETADMEGCSRVLWGLAPLAAGGGESDLWELYREGIVNGTNPSHPEYWGPVHDYDQKLVEMAAYGLAMAIAPERIWEPLSQEERERVYAWFAQINEKALYDCNWLLFLVMVNLGFKRLGLPYDQQKIEANLARIEEYYMDEGWYSDGIGAHCDYYGPFAIHFYCLLYAVWMKEEDPERSKRYRERAALFARQFIHWFAADGSALPYGRSLTYRFAQAAFWSALVYAEEEVYPYGVMKGLILRHLRWWFQQPIFQADGTLSIGYAYPNLIMAENYNAPGSPYWALKTFLILALPESHPFWQAEELPLPALPERVLQQSPHFIVCRHEDHVLAFNSGHRGTNEHTHTSAKYEKFVYSNRFGFSVPRAEYGLGQGAYDSMLALSEGDRLYRVKRTSEEYTLDGRLIHTRWKPWADVEVRTWIIAGAPWHVRIHLIHSGRLLHVADGGFALGIEGADRRGGVEPRHVEDRVLAVSANGASGIVRLYGVGRLDAQLSRADEWGPRELAQGENLIGKVELIYANANTNLLHPRTVIPTVTAELAPGTSLLITAVYGDPASQDADKLWSAVPEVHVKQDEIMVRLGADETERIRI